MSVNQIEDRPLYPLNYGTLEEAGIMPGERPGTRKKPLPLTNGHGRYVAVLPERALVSVGEWPLHAAHFSGRLSSSTPERRSALGVELR
jgi:hypothetical protein